MFDSNRKTYNCPNCPRTCQVNQRKNEIGFGDQKLKMKMCASNSFCPSPYHHPLSNHVFFPLNIDELLVTKSEFK